jgi:hypothetical protein
MGWAGGGGGGRRPGRPQHSTDGKSERRRARRASGGNHQSDTVVKTVRPQSVSFCGRPVFTLHNASYQMHRRPPSFVLSPVRLIRARYVKVSRRRRPAAPPK